MTHCHMVLPSVVAAVLSVGVVTKNKGDFSDCEGVRRRIIAFGTVVVVVREVVLESEGLKGNGMFCVGRREMAERM